MKIKLELFGASRDFSDNDHLEIEVQGKASIEDLSNVNTASPSVGHVLKWTGTEWSPSAESGGTASAVAANPILSLIVSRPGFTSS